MASDSVQPKPSAGRRLVGHLIRLVIGMVSLGGLVLLVYLVVDAVSSGPVLFVVATLVVLVFGAPVFVFGLLAATWRPGASRVTRRLLRRQHVPPSASPPPDPRA